MTNNQRAIGKLTIARDALKDAEVLLADDTTGRRGYVNAAYDLVSTIRADLYVRPASRSAKCPN